MMKGLKKIIRNLIRKYVFKRSFFNKLQKFGITVLPNHYYSGIPNFLELNKEDYWKEHSTMVGVHGTDLEPQLNFMTQCVDAVKDKGVLKNLNIINKAREDQGENGFGVIEADFLYCFILYVKPKKIIQVGCGVSTSVILRAAEENNQKVAITCIEPFPSVYLKELAEQGKIELITNSAQQVEIDKLTALDEGDLLFNDSTHTVKVGSEINRIILEVLPRLKSGVHVHFHDIYFPFDYQRNLQETLYFWNESTLLHSFLIHNSKYKILVSQSMLHYQRIDVLCTLFPNYDPQENEYGLPKGHIDMRHFPASTFLVSI